MLDARSMFKRLPQGAGRHAPRGVSDVQTYLAVQAEQLRRAEADESPREAFEPLVAYVNHDRLLIDCLCGNGVPVLRARRARDDGFAACISCGRVYRHLVVVATLDAVDALLATRATLDRNFDPRPGAPSLRTTRYPHGQTVEDVDRENRERVVTGAGGTR